jgi:lipopolysaccharide transport system permease protein
MSQILIEKQEHWTELITSRRRWWKVNLGELWRYRDLVLVFVKRDFVANYKQTILGPLWFFIQPLLTTFIFLFVFNRIAGIKTGNIPAVLFYLAGLTCWNYFAECFTKTADTFKSNENIFGKVYFPRLVVPVSIVISNGIRFAIQFLLFILFWIFYWQQGAALHPNWAIALLPLLLLIMAGLALGFGLIISSLTTKYRDLYFLITFGVQLWMYATPVIYPLSPVSGTFRKILDANPLTAIIETFKYAFLGEGVFSWGSLGYSAGFTFFVLLLGSMIFHKTEQNFMDTI